MRMMSIARRYARVAAVAASALALGTAFAGATASAASTDGPRHAQKAQPRTLTNISCTSAIHCIAIGRIGTAAFPPSFGQSWNGKSWKLIASPDVDGPLGLDCVGTSFCLVGGNDAGQGQTDTSVWNGKSWKVSQNTPAPSFNQISCATKTFCVTVGFGGTLLSWDGKSWQFFKDLPEPAGVNDFELSGVSCTSVKFCLAVGFFTTMDTDNTQTVAELWDGAAWHLISPPTHNVESTFNAISCTSPVHCIAVGSFITPKPSTSTFTLVNIAAQWNGQKWQVTRLPGQVGNPFGDDLGNRGLESISCPTATSCMAVGNFGARRTQSFGGIAIAWNGGKWQLTKLHGPVSTLNDVSCPAAKDCIAVGRSGNRTMAQRWNGKSWTLLPTP